MRQLSKHVSLKKFNTFGIDTVAENFIEISDNQDIKEAMGWAAEKGYTPIILGGGSNVLFTKDSYPLIVVNHLLGIKKIKENEDYVWVESGAGEIWHDLVLFCLKEGLGGIENLSLIPGTVGAAPMQNIGAYGVEIKEVFESLQAVDLSTFEVKSFNNKECQFGYRESIFKKELKGKFFITSLVLKLSKIRKVNISYGAIQKVLKDKGILEPTINQVSDAVVHIRQSKLPNPDEIGNAGSFFKNPVISKSRFEELRQIHSEIPSFPQEDGQVKVPAGWLIEQCGWKGYCEGSIGVHKKQALVLVNYGGGKGAEIEALASKIKDSVYDKFQINITAEVNIL
ncbi:MAG: UDP-N-acetylmuramate dehydrogenase [Reichenbachiella sp.]|uniref:UDP-N-acetylmuramate dehydrogenase n=1 Tax=Reichenbachiella sp. TaxID=2184521 RepID=UPI00326411C3